MVEAYIEVISSRDSEKVIEGMLRNKKSFKWKHTVLLNFFHNLPVTYKEMIKKYLKKKKKKIKTDVPCSYTCIIFIHIGFI